MATMTPEPNSGSEWNEVNSDSSNLNPFEFDVAVEQPATDSFLARGICSLQKKWHRRLHLTMLVLVIGSIAYVVTNYISNGADSPRPRSPKHKNYSNGGFELILNSDHVIIHSLQDLRNIKGYPSILEVASLTSQIPKREELGEFFRTVSHLRVTGIISEAWLRFLSEYLTALDMIHLNINGLCEGSEERDRDNLPPLKHENIKHLVIEEANMCSIITWVFKFKLNGLKTMILSRVDFNRRSFNGFVKFLTEYKSGIDLVELEQCNFSEECNMSLIPSEIARDKLKLI